MRKEHLETARFLYKHTKEVENLVLDTIKMFDTPLSNGTCIRSLFFDKGYFKLGELSVSKVIRVNNHLGIEIHWYPYYEVSTENDPFCSAFILTAKEAEKFHDTIQKTFSSLQPK